MKVSKKIIIVFTFFCIITMFGNYYIYENSEGFSEAITKNEKMIENTKNYTVEDYYNLRVDQLVELQRLYFGYNLYDKCEIVSKRILDKHNESDLDTLTILSIIYENKHDFENSLKYNYRLIPLVEESKLPVIYDNIADIYLINDLNKSIESLEKALKINTSNSNSNFKNQLELKLKFLKTLKSDFDNEDKSKYYEKIVNEPNINISENVKDYIKK